MDVADIKDAAHWNRVIENLPGSHALQSWQWGQVKSQFGWKPYSLLWRDKTDNIAAAALALQRTLSVGGFALRLSVMYIPRGPLLDWSNSALVEKVLNDLQDFAKRKGAIFLKIDPDLPVGFGVPGASNAIENTTGVKIQDQLRQKGWIFSDEQIQFRNTVLVDLTEDEESMMARMKSKTRYNIRLAERRGVKVRTGNLEDIPLLYQMYAHTSMRDNFLIRNETYYKTVWETFFKAGLAEPLIAEVEGEAVGAVVIFHFGGRAWYIHGMSLNEYREKMFNYRLQWQAMVQSKAAGCHTYDMWGAPDTFNKDDPLWGVFRFKDGFGGQVVRTLGAWDYPIRPLAYRLYSQILPRVLGWMRRHGKSETKRSMNT